MAADFLVSSFGLFRALKTLYVEKCYYTDFQQHNISALMVKMERTRGPTGEFGRKMVASIARFSESGRVKGPQGMDICNNL